MDQNTKGKREKNPREGANIFSILFFFFTYKTFRKGFKRDIQEGDIYEVMKDYRAKKLGDRIEREWEDDKKRHKSPSILRVMIRCFGKTYFSYGIMQLVMKSVLVTISPMAMGRLVSYFTPGQTRVTKLDACLYAVLTIGINTFYFVYSHSYMLLIHQLGLRVRTAFCSFLFRKALKLAPTALAEVTAGRIITLMTKDIHSFEMVIMFFNDLLIGLVQTSIIAYIMYRQIGVSALIGLAVFLLTIPIHLYTGKRISIYRIKSAGKTDDRLRVTQEVLTSMKIIKMFTWEKFFGKSVGAFRKYEVNTLRKIYCLRAFSLALGTLSSKISFYVCVLCYLYFGESITAEKAFVVLGCYQILRSTLTIYIPLGISQIAEFKSAMQRFTQVLVAQEIQPDSADYIEDIKSPTVNLSKVSVETKGSKILDGVTCEINKGLTTIVGSVGSGKSVLLKLILKDLAPSEGDVEITGRISYASQEPWLFPGTIKQNILFGQPFNQQRYRKVLQICCLNQDLQTFPMGDETVAGDRGLNLSRGQQARINLARAVYKDCEIYLLDDSFSALDAGVSREVFNECIRVFLEDKIRLLVTHQVRHLQQADRILVMNQGTIECSGTYKELEAMGRNLNIIDVEESVNERVNEDKVANEAPEATEESELLVPEIGGNVFAEKKMEGKVNWKIYAKYFSFGGGFLVFSAILILFVVAQASTSYSDILVSKWVDIEQKITNYKLNFTEPSAYETVIKNRNWTLNMYNIMIGLATFFTLGRAFAYFIFSSRASISLHKSIFDSILNAPMSFFDSHMMGNILNRFSRDLGLIDDYIPYLIFDISRILLILMGIVYVVCSVHIIFAIPTTILFTILFVARRYYLPTSRSLVRLEGTTRSPVIGHLSASLEGLSTIRACRAEDILQREFDQHLDVFHSVYYMCMTASRAFGFLMDVISVTYIGILTTTFLTMNTGALAGKVGLALTQAFSLTGLLQWGVRQWAELENQMTSVERVMEYSDVKPEEKTGAVPENWPTQGGIKYVDVNLTYGGSEQIFHNLSFEIEPKAKIGIVGRTGAGKSSIIATLFRLYDIDGSITIDDYDIKNVNVEILRSKISIIPQSPVLFSGTIRDNLDPNNEHSDKDLWKALEEVQLKETIPTLLEKIDQGGENYSAGQRQLICLARAIIRNNKILVLDEATANVDPQTDALIQKTIKKIFVNCTVVTIAHRLESVINSDKVMLIHAGKLIEFDSPDVLLSNKDGAFYKMVKQAGLLKS